MISCLPAKHARTTAPCFWATPAYRQRAAASGATRLELACRLLHGRMGKHGVYDMDQAEASDQRQRAWNWAFWVSLFAFEVVGRILALQS